MAVAWGKRLIVLLWLVALLIGGGLSLPLSYWGVSGTLDVVLSVGPMLMALYAASVLFAVVAVARVVGILVRTS